MDNRSTSKCFTGFLYKIGELNQTHAKMSEVTSLGKNPTFDSLTNADVLALLFLVFI